MIPKRKINWIGKPKLIPFYFLKYSYKVLWVLILFFAFCFIFESTNETKVTEFKSLYSIYNIDPYLVSNSKCVTKGTPHSERFESLNGALSILDKTNPTISQWVRDREDSDKLFFIDHRDINDSCKNAIFCSAKFNWINRSLHIDKGIFAESDGEIAVILSHEYRHSRQHYSKMLRYALSTFWTENGYAEIVENDAYLYEKEAYNAIFGQYENGIKK